MADQGKNYLIVFAREPALGQVKQRLAADLGAGPALLVYQRLLERSLRLARSVQRHGLAPDQSADAVHLRIASAGVMTNGCGSIASEARLSQFCQRTGAQLVAQRGNDLGERMWYAIRDVSLDAADRIVLIGSDCPGLQRADVRAAFVALDRTDITLTPTRDGGYCLIGMHGTAPAVFDGVAWGKSTVAEQTRQRCAALGLGVTELRSQADIDFAGDWAHWCARQSGRQLAEYAWEMSAG